jgi:hypothetical protein
VDPHRVLGVPYDATPEEVHAAYRRLARTFHPDAGSVDDTRMAEINAAWQLLRDQPATGSRDVADVEPPIVDAPVRGMRLFTAMLIVALAISFTVIVLVLLIGFGRVGVDPAP